MRIFYLALGVVCVVLGCIGIVVPGLPTTPFLLVAVWAFAKSSARLHTWLLNHKILGRYVRDWESHQVIPVSAKILSGTFMTLTVVMCYLHSQNHLWPTLLAFILAAVFVYVVTRPSRAPSAEI